MHTPVPICARARAQTHARTHTHALTHVHIHTHTHRHTHTHAHKHTHLYTYLKCLYKLSLCNVRSRRESSTSTTCTSHTRNITLLHTLHMNTLTRAHACAHMHTKIDCSCVGNFVILRLYVTILGLHSTVGIKFHH